VTDEENNGVTDYELHGVGAKAHANLLAKARKLVELMDDAETNHGGLIGGVTLRAKNELRLELSKWSK